jgi:glutathione S-transferase
MTDFASRDVPRWEALVLRVAFPLAKALLVRGLRIDAEGVRRSLEKIERSFADVDARLADGRRYLAGERFTAADLTFAALAAPLLGPPEHPYLVDEARTPAPLRALRERFRSTRAGAHVLRMYREHRRSD